MNKKSCFVIFLLIIAILITASPVAAQSGPEDVYVDEGRDDGNEDGSQSNPYNTEAEGYAYARSQPDGANLYIRNEDGTWEKVYVPPVLAAGGGTSIPEITLYILLATLALALVVGGWLLKRRAQKLQG